MSDVDQDLDLCLAAAIAGLEPPNDEWSKHTDLVGGLVGGKSGNYCMEAEATRLLEYERTKLALTSTEYRACIARWSGFFAASNREFMGDEWDSVIYSHRHVLPVTAVAGWCERNFPRNFASVQWLQTFYSIAALITTPDGYWCGFGQRSGGHGTRPSAERATVSYILAVASGVASRKSAMLAAGHAAGAAPAQNWAYAAADTLAQVAQFAYRLGSSMIAMNTLIRGGSGIKFAIPMYRLVNAKGEFAAWIARADGTSSDNNNTPVVPAVVWTEADGDVYAPANGGNHFRSQAERATIALSTTNSLLVYGSDKNASCVLDLPTGVGALETYGV